MLSGISTNMIARVKKQGRTDAMDEWLESKDLYRKHTAKDGSCLFRAVAEQVFLTQVVHVNVRLACLDYIELHKEEFRRYFDGTLDAYVTNMQNPKEWAGNLEIKAMAKLFKRDFVIYKEVGVEPTLATNHGYSKSVTLCLSPGNHYDSIYPKNFVLNAAMCQSLVYDILYKNVFALGDEVDLAVQKMLHDKNYAKHRKDSTASHDGTCQSAEIIAELEILANDTKSGAGCSLIRRALALGIPPFPYKVAKALDSEIYRNVEYDIWNDARKDEPVFEPGVKCLVHLLDNNNLDVHYHCHIQEVAQENGLVTVFVEELGEKRTIPYNHLQPLPSYSKGGLHQRLGKSYRSVANFYPKSNMNGNFVDAEKFRIKRKFPKKSRFNKEGLIPPGQNIPTHIHSAGSYNYYSNNRSYNSFHQRNMQSQFRWAQNNNSYNQRFSNRRGYSCSDRYNDGNSSNCLYLKDHSKSNCYDNNDREENSFSVSHPNSCTDMPEWTAVSQPAALLPSQAGLCQNANGQCELSGEAMSEMSYSRSSSPPSALSQPEVFSSNGANSQASNLISEPSRSNSDSEPMSHCTGGETLNMLNHQPLFSLPQPVNCIQIPMYPGSLLVPYVEVPADQAVNFAAPRSNDINGNDLPLQDLATLRYFFNLGHDYFQILHHARPCTFVNYNGQMFHAPGGFYSPTPEDFSETRIEMLNVEHPVVGEPFTPPNSFPSTGESVIGLMYAGSPIFRMDNADGGFGPVPPDFHAGVVLDEHGMLTLGMVSEPPPTPMALAAPSVDARDRSDSDGSSKSWRSAQDKDCHAHSNNCFHFANAMLLPPATNHPAPIQVPPFLHRKNQPLNSQKPTNPTNGIVGFPPVSPYVAPHVTYHHPSAGSKAAALVVSPPHHNSPPMGFFSTGPVGGPPPISNNGTTQTTPAVALTATYYGPPQPYVYPHHPPPHPYVTSVAQ